MITISKQQYMEDFYLDGSHWASQNDWATNAMVKQADELYPQVVEQLAAQELLLDAGCSQRVYDYCFNDNLNTTVQEVVDELTA